MRNLEHSQHQHTALVEAVLEGDADGAREVMREHCEGTAALLRGFLRLTPAAVPRCGGFTRTLTPGIALAARTRKGMRSTHCVAVRTSPWTVALRS